MTTNKIEESSVALRFAFDCSKMAAIEEAH